VLSEVSQLYPASDEDIISEKEVPVSSSPAEQRLTASARSVPKVIISFGDRRQEIGPFAPEPKIWPTGLFGKIPYCIPNCCVRLKARALNHSIFFSMRYRRKIERTTVSATNDKNSLSGLGNSKIDRIKGLDVY